MADLPSRDKFELLDELGSTSFPVRWPDMEAGWSDVFTRIFDEFAPRPTKAEKRARREVDAAVADARAKRAR